MAFWRHCQLATLALSIPTLIVPAVQPAAAQDTADEPPEVRALATESVDLGSGPVCWDADEVASPAGAAGHRHGSTLSLIYQIQGSTDADLSGGSARIEAGSGPAIPPGEEFRHANAGNAPAPGGSRE